MAGVRAITEHIQVPAEDGGIRDRLELRDRVDAAAVAGQHRIGAGITLLQARKKSCLHMAFPWARPGRVAGRCDCNPHAKQGRVISSKNRLNSCKLNALRQGPSMLMQEPVS